MTNLEQQQAAWDRFATSYDQAITPVSTRAAEAALSLAGVREGDRLLDVAAGPGALSLPAARLGARVLAIDYSASMVDLLAERARAEGLQNLEVRVMDGTALELDDGAFDVACSQLGIMLFPDRAAGLAELARVTRSGGTSVMSVFGPPARVPALAMFFIAAAKSIPGFVIPPPREAPLFCLSDPQDLISEMSAAGFRDIQVHEVESGMHLESATDLWDSMLSAAPAIAGIINRATEAERQATREELMTAFRARFGDGPMEVPFTFHVGIGRR